MQLRTRAAALGTAAAIAACTVACGGKSDTTQTAQRAPVASSPPPSVPTPAMPSDTGPIMVSDHSIIRSEAVGPLHVGEWRRPVMSFVYAITARAGRDSEDVILVRGIGKDTVTLTFDNDTLRKVFVTRAGPHTADGIGVGSPFESVATASGSTVTTRGGAKVATLARLCGVRFATDSLAIAPDSVVRETKQDQTTIRAISVGYCRQ